MNKARIWLLLTGAVASAQGPVFKADTRVVEVAVGAKGASDSAVTDLRRSDFRVFDNGVEQTILSFEAPASTGSVAGGKAPRLAVIVLDAINTDLAGRVRSRKAIAEMLRKLPSGEDRIAIFVLGDTLRLLHDYSANTASLRAAVEGYTGELLANRVADPVPFAGGFSLAAPVSLAPGADSHAELRLSVTLGAFVEIARKMKDVPGEKNLLWLSGGFLPPEDKQDVQAAMRELTSARVTLYPIDARGLLTCLPTGCPPEINLNIASMEELAELTGGRAFHDDNGIAALAREAIDDSREGYVLTYSPANYRKDGSAHTVQLKTSRKSVNLRYRPGYIAD